MRRVSLGMNQTKPIVIHVHDFAGHPFQAELSNYLALKGYEVHHSYFAHVGPVKASLSDIFETGRIQFHEISFDQPYEIRSLLRRVLFELRIARELSKLSKVINPSISIFSNTPLIAASIYRATHFRERFILWHQDIFSFAFAMKYQRSEKKDYRLLKWLLQLIEKVESSLVSRSDYVVCISEDFLPVYSNWNVSLNKVSVIENWAPLDQIYSSPVQRNMNSTLGFVYAGTLGMKHNPMILVELADKLSSLQVDSTITVISEGEGANQLKQPECLRRNVLVEGFVGISELNDIFSRADFALVLLEKEASDFSVPSKAYSYLSAGKCVIAFAPKSNAASRAILACGGFVFTPDSDGVERAANLIVQLSMEDIREIGRQSRAFAEQNFNIGVKGEKFALILQNLGLVQEN